MLKIITLNVHGGMTWIDMLNNLNLTSPSQDEIWYSEGRLSSVHVACLDLWVVGYPEVRQYHRSLVELDLCRPLMEQ